MADMCKSKHYNFITTPIFNILKESVIACRGIGDGIETQTISEYILQTTFLKMTGASEQKLKCICWELATNDYEYRYQYLNKNYGECSNYTDKNAIYNDLIKAIIKLDTSLIKKAGTGGMFILELIDNLKADDFTGSICKGIKNLVEDSTFSLFDPKGFSYFCSSYDTFFKNKVFATLKENQDNNDGFNSFLLANTKEGKQATDELKKYFESIVYRHRNRCAHNLTSYQENLPTLSTLSEKYYDYNNYFFRFSLLILIDKIFIRLYEKYIDTLEKNAYA
ncbi:MAG: hypothetical protein UH077_06520 [Bacteroidales bacterium]|nr:hypothetical protein [Bacteroidales bacterium]